MVHFGEFLKTWSLRSNSVTRQVSFNRTKIGGKCQTSNATFWVIFKQCAYVKGVMSSCSSGTINCWTDSFPSTSIWRCFGQVASWWSCLWHCFPVLKEAPLLWIPTFLTYSLMLPKPRLYRRKIKFRVSKIVNLVHNTRLGKYWARPYWMS